jgi:hypothetical protein
MTGFIWHTQLILPISSTTPLSIHTFTIASTESSRFLSIYPSPLEMASNGRLSPSSGFPNSPRPPATATLDSQWPQQELNSKSPINQSLLYGNSFQHPNSNFSNQQLNWSSSWSSSWSWITTDSQSASLSWRRAPIWSPWADSWSVWQLRVSWCGAPSLMRGRVCNIMLLLGFSGRNTLFYCPSFWDSPNIGGPGPRIYIPQEEVGPVIPPRTGFPFRHLLRLEGYGGANSILPPDG